MLSYISIMVLLFDMTHTEPPIQARTDTLTHARTSACTSERRGRCPNCAPEINAPSRTTDEMAGGMGLMMVIKVAHFITIYFFGESSSGQRLLFLSDCIEGNVSFPYPKSDSLRPKNKDSVDPMSTGTCFSNKAIISAPFRSIIDLT